MTLGDRLEMVDAAGHEWMRAVNWNLVREQALVHEGALRQLRLNHALSGISLEDPRLQLLVIRQAWKDWETTALKAEVFLWDNVLSAANSGDRRCRALLKLRRALEQ